MYQSPRGGGGTADSTSAPAVYTCSPPAALQTPRPQFLQTLASCACVSRTTGTRVYFTNTHDSELGKNPNKRVPCFANDVLNVCRCAAHCDSTTAYEIAYPPKSSFRSDVRTGFIEFVHRNTRFNAYFEVAAGLVCNKASSRRAYHWTHFCVWTRYLN